jgi:hypothetical protein
VLRYPSGVALTGEEIVLTPAVRAAAEQMLALRQERLR